MKRCLHTLFWGLLLTVSITACQQDTPTSPNIRVHLLSEPRSLHPMNSNVATKNYILRYTHERLNTIDLETGEIIPQLASLPEESEDQLSYTFTLKPEASWPDGKPLTAEDVLFTVKAMACPGVTTQLKAYLDFLKDLKIDPTNNKRFTVEMKSYYMNNPNFGIFAFVLDPRKYDKEGLLAEVSLADMIAGTDGVAEDTSLQAFANQFNEAHYGRAVESLQGGSGPYRFYKWEPDVYLSLVRNESYWGKGMAGELFQQVPDTIEFIFQKEDQLIENLFKSQELDVSSYLGANVFEALQASPSVSGAYSVSKAQLGSYVAITLNTQPEAKGLPAILSDKRVRQALDIAIDKEGIREEALRGYAQPASSPLRPDNALFHSELPARTHDPKQAAALLEEAGWTDQDGDGIREKMLGETLTPLKISFFYADGSQGIRQAADRVKANLAQVGIELELKPAPSIGKYINNIVNGNYDAALISLGASPLPYDFKQLFHSDQWLQNSRNNFSGFVNSRADSLIDALRASPDLALRKQMAWEVQEILKEEVPMISLYFTTRKHCISKRLGDMPPLKESPFFYLNALPEAAN